MRFTFESYEQLIERLIEKGYVFADYLNWSKNDMTVIMRHDVDLDLKKAATLSEIEKSMGISSTYFVLLTSDFYNLSSEKSQSFINTIIENGCSIGLHFDEKRYPDDFGCEDKTVQNVIREIEVLSQILRRDVNVFSMHRPSKKILDSDIKIPRIINTYGKTFFKEFKYLSDSRRLWREDIDDIVAHGKYSHLQILTHAFWYNAIEKDIHDSVLEFINDANHCRYLSLKDNITDIDSIILKEEVL